MAPINELTKKDVPFEWTAECNEARENMRQVEKLSCAETIELSMELRYCVTG